MTQHPLNSPVLTYQRNLLLKSKPHLLHCFNSLLFLKILLWGNILFRCFCAGKSKRRQLFNLNFFTFLIANSIVTGYVFILLLFWNAPGRFGRATFALPLHHAAAAEFGLAAGGARVCDERVPLRLLAT